MNGNFIFVVLVLSFLVGNVPSAKGESGNFLGPQSTWARGEKRVLMVAVKFPDAQPGKSLDEIKKRAALALNDYLTDQSYGQISLTTGVEGR